MKLKRNKVPKNIFGPDNKYANPSSYMYIHLTKQRNVIFNPFAANDDSGSWISCKEEVVSECDGMGTYVIVAVYNGKKLTQPQLTTIKTKINRKFPNTVTRLLKIPGVDSSVYLEVNNKLKHSVVIKHCIISVFRMLVRRQLKLNGISQDKRHSKYVNRMSFLMKKHGYKRFSKMINSVQRRLEDMGYESNGPESIMRDIEQLYGSKKEIQLLLELCLP